MRAHALREPFTRSRAPQLFHVIVRRGLTRQAQKRSQRLRIKFQRARKNLVDARVETFELAQLAEQTVFTRSIRIEHFSLDQRFTRLLPSDQPGQMTRPQDDAESRTRESETR